MRKILLAFLLLARSIQATPIDVSQLATSGNGSQSSCWTGWDTAATWVGEQEYYFPGGVYCYSVSPNFLKTGIALRGEAGTVLKHTGSGNAVVFDDPVSWTFNVRMENFIIQGNAATTNGLFLRGVRNSIFKHISVRDVSNAGLWNEACVTNILENFRVSHHEMPNDRFNVVPKYGFVSETRTSNNTYSTTWTVINPVIEGVSQIGIWLLGPTYGNTFINGTSEGNLGKGAVIGQVGRSSGANTFINSGFEANAGTDVEIYGSGNIFENVVSATSVSILGGSSNQLLGGNYGNIALNSHTNVLQGITRRGTLTDNDTQNSTIKIGNIGPSENYPNPGNIPLINILTLNYGPSVETDASRGTSFAVFAYGNFLLNNPTKVTDGQLIRWRIINSSGSPQISFGSKFRPKPGSAFPVLTPILYATDYITAIYNARWDSWDIQ